MHDTWIYKYFIKEKISCLIAADFLLHKTYDTAPIDL